MGNVQLIYLIYLKLYKLPGVLDIVRVVVLVNYTKSPQFI